jgi:outer membrane lipoprotein-sorting protein
MNVVALTFIGWISALIAVIFLILAICLKFEGKSNKVWIFFTAAALCAVIAGIALFCYFTTTAVGQQKVKSWNAQSVGIYREMEVYSMSGDKIAEYKGMFNIEYDSERVEIYDTENKERILVYYKNGTIIVTEPDTEDR